jgi:hypothetical protein
VLNKKNMQEKKGVINENSTKIEIVLVWIVNY